MTREEQISILIDQYVNIKRIKSADDRDRELDKQEKVLAVKLETLGVALDRLPE